MCTTIYQTMIFTRPFLSVDIDIGSDYAISTQTTRIAPLQTSTPKEYYVGDAM